MLEKQKQKKRGDRDGNKRNKCRDKKEEMGCEASREEDDEYSPVYYIDTAPQTEEIDGQH